MPVPTFVLKPQSLLSLAIATLATAPSVLADTPEEKITITGRSIAADQVISQETLQNFQANDLEDIFRHTPEVNVGGGFGTAQKIYVRGIEDINLNISIDGAQQAGYLFHHQGQLNIEPELIKQVEVQAGAGLATDGPGALGGAIRFITKDPEDLLRDGESVGALLKLGYFDNTDGYKAHASVFGRISEKLSALVSVTRQDTDNIEDGFGNEQTNTKSKLDSGLFKLVAQLTDDQTIRLSHEVRNDDGRRNIRAHFVSAGWNSARAQENHRDTTTLKYNYNPEQDNLDVQATAYHTDAYITQKPDGGTKNGAGVESFGFDLRNTQQLGDQNLTYGIDYRHDTGSYINPITTGGRPTDDEDLSVIGLYVQDHIALTERLSLNAGVRYDRYDMDDNIGQTFKDDGFSPNIGLGFAVNEALELHAGYSRALRGVNVKEAYLLNFATNDPNRKAEKADNFEVGFDYSSGGLSYGGTAYVSHIDNAVDRNGSVVSNVGDVKTKGVTAYLGYAWDQTDVQLGYSHSSPELNGEPLGDGDMGLGTATGDTLTVSFAHHLPEHNLEFGWSSELVKRLTDVPSGRQEKAGYGVHDVYAKWNPLANEDLSLTLTIKNLFDKGYYSHASYTYSTSSGDFIGLTEAGRDVRLTMAMRF